MSMKWGIGEIAGNLLEEIDCLEGVLEGADQEQVLIHVKLLRFNIVWIQYLMETAESPQKGEPFYRRMQGYIDIAREIVDIYMGLGYQN